MFAWEIFANVSGVGLFRKFAARSACGCAWEIFSNVSGVGIVYEELGTEMTFEKI